MEFKHVFVDFETTCERVLGKKKLWCEKVGSGIKVCEGGAGNLEGQVDSSQVWFQRDRQV